MLLCSIQCLWQVERLCSIIVSGTCCSYADCVFMVSGDCGRQKDCAPSLCLAPVAVMQTVFSWCLVPVLGRKTVFIHCSCCMPKDKCFFNKLCHVFIFYICPYTLPRLIFYFKLLHCAQYGNGISQGTIIHPPYRVNDRPTAPHHQVGHALRCSLHQRV